MKSERSVSLYISKYGIDAVFDGRKHSRWDKYLDVYDYLLKGRANARLIADYERRFNYFYQVRRNARWRRQFYAIFYRLCGGFKGGLKNIKTAEKNMRAVRADFQKILEELVVKTGKLEASFASKMAAILDPGLPIIDRHVLSYIGEKLPPAHYGRRERVSRVVELHGAMQVGFNKFLRSKEGRYLIKRFKEEYPKRKISEMKMLDFVLWLSGGRHREKNRRPAARLHKKRK